MLKKALLASLFMSLFAAALAQAAVVRLEVKERSDVLDGKTFGTVGAYERIVGKAYFAINPKLAANQAIADIDKAPRNQDGLVEFSSDVFLLRPKDPKKGNGTVLYEVSNRGSNRCRPTSTAPPVRSTRATQMNSATVSS